MRLAAPQHAVPERNGISQSYKYTTIYHLYNSMFHTFYDLVYPCSSARGLILGDAEISAGLWDEAAKEWAKAAPMTDLEVNASPVLVILTIAPRVSPRIGEC